MPVWTDRVRPSRFCSSGLSCSGTVYCPLAFGHQNAQTVPVGDNRGAKPNAKHCLGHMCGRSIDWRRRASSRSHWIPSLQTCSPPVQNAKLKCRLFIENTIFRTIDGAAHAGAILACVALLYFAAGGSFLHEHTNGPDTACHVCQALHHAALARRRSICHNLTVTCIIASSPPRPASDSFPASRRARPSHFLNSHPWLKCISVRWPS